MDRDAILRVLHNHIQELKKQGVKSLMLFGPTARNEAKPNSEINFLLELEPPYTFEQFLKIKLYLNTLLDRSIELVVANPQNPEIWPYVGPDLILIA